MWTMAGSKYYWRARIEAGEIALKCLKKDLPDHRSPRMYQVVLNLQIMFSQIQSELLQPYPIHLEQLASPELE